MDCSAEHIIAQQTGNEGMMDEGKEARLSVGIDIAAQTFTAAWGSTVSQIGAAQTFSQTVASRRMLIRKLQATGYAPDQTRVVMEATGTYWMQCAVTLHEAGYRVSVINPRQAHHFAEALLKQAKTDGIDAQTLAQLALTLPLTSWDPPGEVWEGLYQRLVEHDNLTEMRQVLRNQLHALRQRVSVDPAVEARKRQLLADLDQQIKTVEAELTTWLRQSNWADLARRVQAIPGIGLLSTAWLLVVTNGFTTCEDAEQLASYLGLVPHPQQSGSSRHGHRRPGHTGHARARRVLYQAAVSAARFNPAVQAFYQRLLARGKHTKTARCAAARKLVHIAFAVATKDQPYDPAYHLSCQPPLAA